MRKRSNAVQVKADRVLRLRAAEASTDSMVREPPPDTWPATEPPYKYTVLCPDARYRRGPDAVMRARRKHEVGILQRI